MITVILISPQDLGLLNTPSIHGRYLGCINGGDPNYCWRFRNPKQPPGMCSKPRYIMGFQLPTYLNWWVTAGFLNHQQYLRVLGWSSKDQLVNAQPLPWYSFAHHDYDAQENAIQVGLSSQVSRQGSQGSWIMEIVHEWGAFFFEHDLFVVQKGTSFSRDFIFRFHSQNLGQSKLDHFLKQLSKDWKFI